MEGIRKFDNFWGLGPVEWSTNLYQKYEFVPSHWKPINVCGRRASEEVVMDFFGNEGMCSDSLYCINVVWVSRKSTYIGIHTIFWTKIKKLKVKYQPVLKITMRLSSLKGCMYFCINHFGQYILYHVVVVDLIVECAWRTSPAGSSCD